MFKVTKGEGRPTVADCVNCGEPMTADWWQVDDDPICGREDCGPSYEELATPEGQARLFADRLARPAQSGPEALAEAVAFFEANPSLR